MLDFPAGDVLVYWSGKYWGSKKVIPFKASSFVTLQKTNMAMGNPLFEDVFPVEKWGFSSQPCQFPGVFWKKHTLAIQNVAGGHQESTVSHPVISVEVSCPWISPVVCIWAIFPTQPWPRGWSGICRDFASTKFQVSSLFLSNFGCLIFLYVIFSFQRGEKQYVYLLHIERMFRYWGFFLRYPSLLADAWQ